MKEREMLKFVDHTLLAQTATWDQIKSLCDEAMACKTASVCIPPSFVKQASAYVEDRMKICTVIGFPNGYSTTAVKCLETKEALENGADEIDMVINVGWVKEGRYDLVEQEIRALKEICGTNILKVIIETCLLTREEKIRMCRAVTDAGADFIKTSTGFSTAGATFEDVKLFAEHVGPKVKIKAAGGISTLEDAETFLNLGASRLGTSRMVKLVKEPSGDQHPSGDRHPSGDQQTRRLISLAAEAMGKAYAPYSGFQVGAALMTESGKVYQGCNIENAAYTPTNCAERTAFFKAVSEGERKFAAICIVGGMKGIAKEFTAPCGVCRQVMREFCDPDTFRVILAVNEDQWKEYRLKELLPESFGPDNLSGKDSEGRR